MKVKTIVFLSCIAFLILALASCKYDNHSSDEIYFASVKLTVKHPGQHDSRSMATSGSTGTYLISVISGEISSVDTGTDLSVAYDRQLLAVDNSVNLQVPLVTPIRLVKADYSSEFTLAQLLSNEPTPNAVGLSDAFTINAGTTEKSVEITMNTGSISVISTSPADASTDVSVDTTISATFSVAMNTSTITTNSGDPTCTGSFQVSKDDFSSCIALVSTVAASNSNKTFTVTPSSDLDYNSTYKIKITTVAGSASKLSSANIHPGKGLAQLPVEYVSATGFKTVFGTVLIANIRDNGVIHTGFLIGTVSAGDETVSTVEVSIDSGTYQSATVSGSSWTFTLPAGTGTWKDWSQHTVMVRATTTTSKTTSITSITIRKGTNQDVNGDGYGDAVVGAPLVNFSIADRGRAYLYLGSSSGLNSTATAKFTGDSGLASGHMGNAVFLADINGDGYADVIVGENQCSTNVGETHIFHGGPSGKALTDQNLASGGTTNTTISGAGAVYFGTAVAAGDINGDGYADLVASAPNAATNKGVLYIFYGKSAGITSGGMASADNTITGPATYNLGNSVAIGDINGDGYADVVAGSTYYPGDNTGRVWMFLSSGSGGISTIADANVSANQTLDGELASSFYGYSAALGDLNGDGFADFAVGARGWTSSTGRAYVYHGSSSGLSTSPDSTFTGAGTVYYLGQSLAFGNPNGDAYADLLIGARRPGSYGLAYIHHGSSSGLPASASTTLTGFESGGQLGQAVSYSDVNGDGLSDAIVGAIGYSSSTGRAYLFNAGTNGIPTTDLSASGTADVILEAEAATDNFGSSVH